MKNDRKENWRNYIPPLIPIFYAEYNHLKTILTDDVDIISFDGLNQMLGYFEEFEEYEKAEIVLKAINKKKYLETGETTSNE